MLPNLSPEDVREDLAAALENRERVPAEELIGYLRHSEGSHKEVGLIAPPLEALLSDPGETMRTAVRLLAD